ncbi:hypothetical protein LINGRAHAP2_LOCUS19735, partial [Linum grandiflorum]
PTTSHLSIFPFLPVIELHLPLIPLRSLFVMKSKSLASRHHHHLLLLLHHHHQHLSPFFFFSFRLCEIVRIFFSVFFFSSVLLLAFSIVRHLRTGSLRKEV